MKKRSAGIMAAIFVVTLLAGCGSAKKTQESDRVNVWDYKLEDYITLGEYQNLEISVPKEEVTDEMVDSQAWSFFMEQVSKESGGIVDRAVAAGDTVIMDFVGKQDGVAFEGGTAQNYSLIIGSGQFIDGFEDGLIGVMPGETVDLNLTFPEDYHSAALAGAEVVFTVTVHYIQPTEMTDAAVEGFGNENYKTVKELKDYSREALEAKAVYYYEIEREGALLSVLVNNCTFSQIPEELLAQSEKQVADNLATMAAQYGVDAETYVYYFYDMDYDTFLARNAVFSTQMLLATYAVAEEEGLFPEGKALDEELRELAELNNIASKEELLEMYDIDVIKEDIMYRNVVEYLTENAQVSEE